jgi:hypothetical protein
MIALFGEKEGDRLWTSLQENVIEMLCTYYLRAEDIFWVQIIKYEKSLQRNKRTWRNITISLCNISARRATEEIMV